ncbi:hypothetical protein LCGC14_2313010, partial [marine sediment metagenome]
MASVEAGLRKPLKERVPVELQLTGGGTTAKRATAVFKAGRDSQALGEGETLAVLYASKRIVDPPFDMDAFADFYERIDAVGASVDLLVQNLVGMGHEIVPKERPAGGSDVTPAEDDGDEPSAEQREWCREVFDRPNNDLQTFEEVMKPFLVDYYTLGQGYLEITRNGDGRIDNIYHLPARTIKIRVDEHGRMEGYVQVVGRKVQSFRRFGDTEHRFATLEPLTATDDWDQKDKDFLEKATIRLPVSYADSLDVEKADTNGTQDLNEIFPVHRKSPRRGLYGVPALSAVFEDCVGLMNYKIFNANYFNRDDIYTRYPIMPTGGWTLAEHNQISNTYTACPSDRVDWEALMALLVTQEVEDMATAFWKATGPTVYFVNGNTK